MKTYTLAQLLGMNDDEVSDIIVSTVSINRDKDLYLDKLDSGQFVISYAEIPQAVFDTYKAAEIYFNKATS